MNTLLSILKNLENSKILVIGDVMLDVYVYGSVKRISPEAPIPIFTIEEKKEMLGGAGNVINNLVSLKAKGSLVSLIGKDENGGKIGQLLNQICCPYHLESCLDVPTTIKTRFVSGNQQLLRTDSEKIVSPGPSIERNILEYVAKLTVGIQAIILSDYKKGLLSVAICTEIINFANSRGIPVFVDPKGKDFSIYRNATLIKPNRKELYDVFPETNIRGREADFAKKILNQYNIEYCLLTLGNEGMLLISKDGEIPFKALKKEVFDVSGAGDTVIAVLAAAYTAGATMQDSCFLSNVAGGIAVSKAGTSTVTLSEIERELQINSKVFTCKELSEQIVEWKENRFNVGFTNGCFDILHAGHLQTLIYAKKQCDKLIVALNSDSSIKKLKGYGRPIIHESQRAFIIGQLECVDAVVIFNDDSPEKLIREVKPDILIKGSDYNREDVVGSQFVESYGGKLLLAPLFGGLSTTKIISQIVTVHDDDIFKGSF